MRFHRRLSLVLLAGVIGFASPAFAQEAEQAIHEVNAAFMAAVAAHDADAIVTLYTPDGQMMPPNAPAAQGPDELRAFMQGMFDMGVGKLDLSTDELMVEGDTAMGCAPEPVSNVHAIEKLKLVCMTGSPAALTAPFMSTDLEIVRPARS